MRVLIYWSAGSPLLVHFSTSAYNNPELSYLNTFKSATAIKNLDLYDTRIRRFVQHFVPSKSLSSRGRKYALLPPYSAQRMDVGNKPSA